MTMVVVVGGEEGNEREGGEKEGWREERSVVARRMLVERNDSNWV